MLYYCGFDTFLKFKNKSGKNNIFLQPLSDLVLDRKDKVINAFIGWCSLFLQTGEGQVLYLGYSKCQTSKDKNVEQNNMVVCSEVPKYIVNIECGSKETFLITIDLDLYKWSGFNFAKTFPKQILLSELPTEDNPTNDILKENGQETNGNCSDISQFKVEQFGIGVEYSCLLTDTGKAFLFDLNGVNLGNQLSLEKISSISVGQEHILLLTETGNILSYGKGSRGQLGHGNLENVTDVAKPLEALEGIKCKSIAAGGWHSIALADTGDVYVWGWNESGQLGLSRNRVTMEALPILLEISEDDSFMAISAGSRHSMAVSENGILFGWGWNKWGQLGLDPKTIDYCDTPQVIPVDEKVSGVCCKYWSSLIETELENCN